MYLCEMVVVLLMSNIRPYSDIMIKRTTTISHKYIYRI